MDMSKVRQRFPKKKAPWKLPVFGAFLAFSLPSLAMAEPTTLPWSDGDDTNGEMTTDIDGTKLKMTKKEKAARAEELAPQLTSMITSPDFPDYEEATTRVDAQYVVYLGGFHLSSLTFSTAINDEGYEIRSNIHTDGIVDKFVRTNANIGSKGSFAEGRVTPQNYNSDITDKNQRQLVAISYEDVLPKEILSFPRYNLEKHPVSDLDKRKTVDPISAIMQIGLGAAYATASQGANPCGGKIPVFDGRRRFDLTLEYEKTEVISSGKEGAYEGEALKCWVGFKRISGYKPPKKKKKRPVYGTGKSEWPDVYMWLAPVKGKTDMYVPVRLQARTKVGSVVLRATHLKAEVIEAHTPIQHAQHLVDDLGDNH